MPPSPEDLDRLVRALFTVSSGLDRARRNIPDAAALSVLQVLGMAEKVEAGRGLRPSEIAGALQVHRSAVTHHVQALTRAGHVSLTVDPKDRRSSFVSLTEAGHAEIARLTAQGMARFASFVADWPAREVQELSRLLEKFARSKAAVGESDPPPTTASAAPPAG